MQTLQALLCALLVLLLSADLCLGKSVGILYEVWHTNAAQLMKQVKSKGAAQLTVEKVIRSNGQLSLDDVYVKHGLPNGDIYNVEPADLGFYCLYRPRGNDTSGAAACDNIPNIAQAHAKMLLDAHIDYVTVDITNWPIANAGTDHDVIRPTEVLFEEWLSLRKRGIQTPQISVWPCSPASTASDPASSTWKYLLEHLYNDPQYDALIYKIDGKKVVFLPKNSNCYDANVERLIRSNGGRNDVVTVPMWAQFPFDDFSKGVWGFFSMCVHSNSYTSSIVGTSECAQPVTYFSGDSSRKQVSVSPSYQSNWASLPGGAAGKLRGLTLYKQFQRVFEESPEFVFVSSFNEHIGGRQPGISSGNMWFDQGLPFDSQNKQLWVDTYSTEFSRDLEPSIEGGDFLWNLLSSCLMLYKKSVNCSQAPSELCCQKQDFNVFSNAWALRLVSGQDYLVTTDENEKNVLVNSGGWQEVCMPTPGPALFCVDTGSSYDGRAGPFILYSQQVPNAKLSGLYRCITPGSRHFMSLDQNCEQLGHAESLMGYVSQLRCGETARALTRCARKPSAGGGETVFRHSLDLNCDSDEQSEHLGFVH